MEVLKWCTEHESSALDEASIDISLKEHNSLEIVEWKCNNGHFYKKSIRERVMRNRGCPYCAGKRVSDEYNSLYKLRPDLANEWDYENNPTDLTPHTVTPGSNKMANWVCNRGHRWKAMISNRGLKNSGCPVCNNGSQTSMMECILYNLIKYNFNDAVNRVKINGMEFDIVIPSMNILIEYNGRLFHSEVVSEGILDRDNNKLSFAMDNGLRILRVCEEYSYNKPYINLDTYSINFGATNIASDREKAIISLIPYIEKYFKDRYNISIRLNNPNNLLSIAYKNMHMSEIEASLGNQYPQLAAEWDAELNGNITPFMVRPQSNKPVSWKCSTCGYQWKTSPAHRVADGTGCPKCVVLNGSGSGSHLLVDGVNDLKTLRPDLFNQIRQDDNPGIDVSKLHIKSNIKVTWRCDKCGGTWIAPVSRRTSSPNPKCSVCINKVVCRGINDLKTVNSAIAYEFDSANNKDKSENTLGFSNKLANWRCNNCGGNWSSTISERTKEHKPCPHCKYRI